MDMNGFQAEVYGLARPYTDFGKQTTTAQMRCMGKLREEAFEVYYAWPFRDRMIEELGDLLFCVAQTATELGVPLSVIAAKSIQKITERRAVDNRNVFEKLEFSEILKNL